MSTTAVGGLTSVIIPWWNQLEYTRKCIAVGSATCGPSPVRAVGQAHALKE